MVRNCSNRRWLFVAFATLVASSGCCCLKERAHERAAIMRENFDTLMAPADPPSPPFPRFHPVPTRPVFTPPPAPLETHAQAEPAKLSRNLRN